MTRKLRIIVLLLSCIVLVMLWNRGIKQWFVDIKKETMVAQQIIDQDDDEVIDTKAQVGNIVAVGQGMAYDYRRLVKLVKKAQQVKDGYSTQFIEDMPHQQRKHLDKQDIRMLLSDLYRERVRLARFTKELKLLRHGQLPLRQSRALSYYDGVLEKYIKNLEFILRQI